jgi:hypothetical protein
MARSPKSETAGATPKEAWRRLSQRDIADLHRILGKVSVAELTIIVEHIPSALRTARWQSHGGWVRFWMWREVAKMLGKHSLERSCELLERREPVPAWGAKSARQYRRAYEDIQKERKQSSPLDQLCLEELSQETPA